MLDNINGTCDCGRKNLPVEHPPGPIIENLQKQAQLSIGMAQTQPPDIFLAQRTQAIQVFDNDI
jgi:hypothetical protein